MSHPPRRALLSVSDKRGIESFGRELVAAGFELLSTGGTADALRRAGLPVRDVAEITGHPEMMDGRVKTLHPAVHAGILARRELPSDLEEMAREGYEPIDLVAVNLYPFRETIARGGVSVADGMKQVDIGGPTMIRASAKNHAHVWVVVDPDDYPRVLEGLARPSEETRELRRELAAKVFRHTAAYDAAIGSFLTDPPTPAGEGEGPPAFPALLLQSLERIAPLRYGENPDQSAALYAPEGVPRSGIAALRQHHGKELSYNNLLDLDGALLALSPFATSPLPAVSIVKHTTPCGLAIGATLAEAMEKALRTDPVSAFGGILAMNREMDGDTVRVLGDLFAECIVAPSFSEEAMELLTRKKNLRLMTLPGATGADHTVAAVPEAARRFIEASIPESLRPAAHFLAAHGRTPEPAVSRGIYGGVLLQGPPLPPFFGVADEGWKVVTKRAPTPEESSDLAFAWAAVFGVKSNAILLARGGGTLGIGAGQMSRVDASRLAVQKAGDQGLDLQGAALASDAFFPFRDGVEAAAAAGIRAIIQPGGSIRDEEVISAADEAGMAMIFTGRRLFRH